MLTAEQKVKMLILTRAIDMGYFDYNLSDITEENQEEVWDLCVEQDGHYDAQSEVRQGDRGTNIPCDYSRHYETKSVAAYCEWDNSWVGWTYYYGGGKHSEPEAIDWIEHAYDVDCVSEEKLVVVHTFSKKGEQQ
jgi:hypothetical protein